MANHINRHDELRALLERLNLGGMAAVFADLALKAAKENLSHEAYLLELGKHEEELRTQRRTARLLAERAARRGRCPQTQRRASPTPCSSLSSPWRTW